VKFTSRILEGLMARRGLVEPRAGIGWPFLYWVVVVAVGVAAVDPSAARVSGPKYPVCGRFLLC
jgi:hypothetical protein